MSRDKSHDKRFTSTDPKVIELAHDLRRFGDDFRLRMSALERKYREEHDRVVKEAQAAQEAKFKAIAEAMNIGADYHGGPDWTLDIGNLLDGEVTLKYEADTCDCPACQLRRKLKTGMVAEDAVDQVLGTRQVH